MYFRSTKCEKISAGIISFRNLGKGLMTLKIKNSQSDLIDNLSIDNFEEELKNLVTKIMDPNVDFIASGS
jgi:hypothetical protein